MVVLICGDCGAVLEDPGATDAAEDARGYEDRGDTWYCSECGEYVVPVRQVNVQGAGLALPIGAG